MTLHRAKSTSQDVVLSTGIGGCYTNVKWVCLWHYSFTTNLFSSESFFRLCSYVAYLFRHHEINRTASKKVEKKTDEFQERKVNEALWSLNESGCAVGFRPLFWASGRLQSSGVEILLKSLKMQIESISFKKRSLLNRFIIQYYLYLF